MTTEIPPYSKEKCQRNTQQGLLSQITTNKKTTTKSKPAQAKMTSPSNKRNSLVGQSTRCIVPITYENRLNMADMRATPKSSEDRSAKLTLKKDKTGKNPNRQFTNIMKMSTFFGIRFRCRIVIIIIQPHHMSTNIKLHMTREARSDSIRAVSMLYIS